MSEVTIIGIDLAMRVFQLHGAGNDESVVYLVLAYHSQDAREGGRNVLPIKRYARREEIAQAAAFLLDPQRSGFITGHTLAVDGGFLARGKISETAAAGLL